MSGYKATRAWRKKHPALRDYRREEARKWRAAHPEKAKEIQERYRAKNMNRIRELDAKAARRRRRNNPEQQRVRNRNFKARRDEKIVQIAGRGRPENCELCGEFHKSIVFDHCHIGGHFRGWICDRCNKVLGLIRDDVELLGKMIVYLETNRKQLVDLDQMELFEKEAS